MSDLKHFGVILLYVIGMGLVVAEALLPGAVLGIIGFVCILAAIWLAFGLGAGFGWTLLIVTVVAVPFLVWLWIWIFKRAMMMREVQTGTSAMVELKSLVGHQGVALTQLRT